MAVRLLTRFSQLSLCSGRNLVPSCAATTTQARSYCVYNDPNFKTIPSTMGMKRKHWNPKFKRDRRNKFIKMKFPDLNESKNNDNLSPDEIRAKMKEKGVQPVRPWQEKPYFISSTAGTFEQYVPPEGDGKMSIASSTGAKQKIQFIEKKGKSMMAIRKIRQFEETFDPDEFAEYAQQLYIDTHVALANFDSSRLHQLVTERAYPLVTHEVRFKTLHWQFIKSLEPPQVVHARTTDLISKDNVFGQVTVRFHTQQMLAIYDRFGRLQYGSEVVARDVLEYVVFEKHMAHTYGSWRLHDKVIPDWLPPRPPVIRTHRVQQEVEEEEEKDNSTEVVQQSQTSSMSHAVA